ncbi:pectate lyase [Streptomyces sp. NPDC051218]|uniref:pectate lyase n=1 Tax=Streptomyces sp. NPDC051218 TaxID=3365645 RepID=UPI00378A0DE7
MAGPGRQHFGGRRRQGHVSKGTSTGSTYTVYGGGAKKADDKVFQSNGADPPKTGTGPYGKRCKFTSADISYK